MDYVTIKDSSVISITYMEYFINTSEKHVGSSIWIKSDNILKFPVEINIDSLKKIQTEYFSLNSQEVDVNIGGIQKGNTIYFSSGMSIATAIHYMGTNFKKQNIKEYVKNQKVGVPSINIKQEGVSYKINAFKSYPPTY